MKKMTPDFVQPDLKEVEKEYWYLITESDSHGQVQQESIDTGSSSDGYRCRKPIAMAI